MTSPFRDWIRSDREGQTLAVVAVSMVALLAIMSLGIDLGMAYTARAEAQRVADATALAGASVFWEEAPTEALAKVRALEFATQNFVRNRPVAEDDVEVWVEFDKAKVWARVERKGLPTWFARFIGQDHLTVSAIAAASVMDTGAAKCLKPWAVIDLFHDQKINGVRPPHDADPPVLYDKDKGHWYAPNTSDHIENAAEPATGYGAEGEKDFGKELVIKAQDPNDPNVPQPGVFLPIRLPDDPGQEQCFSGGGGSAGASPYRNNICGCNRNPIKIGQELPIQPGNMVGPTRQGIDGLLAEEERTLVWRDAKEVIVDGEVKILPPGVVDAADANGPLVTQSPLIAPMILIGPDQITSSGMQTVEVTNLALFFIEGIKKVQGKDQVQGRFFGPVKGTNPLGNTTSPQVKILRLVE
jgi:hypothetical protein